MHCSICHLDKHVKLSFSNKGYRYNINDLFELVHLDVWGRYHTLHTITNIIS